MRRVAVWIALLTLLGGGAFAEEAARRAFGDADMSGILSFASEYGAEVDPSAVAEAALHGDMPDMRALFEMLKRQLVAPVLDALRALEQTAEAGGADGAWLVKLCGLTLVAELASDLCRDAGESVLAKRIDMGVRLSVTAAALPLAARILERVSELLA